MEEKSRLYHEWTVIFNNDFESLTRPSKELFQILCNEHCLSVFQNNESIKVQ